MIVNIRDLPIDSFEDFVEGPHIPAAAESYLRRALEALLDLGRHMLAEGFGRATSEYKEIADELQSVGVLTFEESQLLREMAGYRNRLVHFYNDVAVEELYEICTQYLSDVERVADALEHWIREHPDRIDTSL